ncbi:hyaluronan-binding protein 2-like, partial [Clarias magur]
LSDHGHHHHHDRDGKHGRNNHKEKPKERHGDQHEKRRGRVEALRADYDDDSRDDEDDEEKGEWLFQLQDVRGGCKPNPCLNNGVCEERRGRFKCRCPKPFKGRKCEKGKRACKRDTCGYGQCVLTSSPPYFECKCKAPFKGPDCKKIAPCERNPCLNGGTCKIDGEDFDCICKTGFSGNFCQVGPNDCYKGNGESYRGMVSETEEGHDCLFWSSYFLLAKGINPFNANSDPQGLGPHNYCRNPDGDSKPWCFARAEKMIRWEYCNVRKCPTDPHDPPVEKPTPAHPPVVHPDIKPIPPGTSDVPESPTPGNDTVEILTPGNDTVDILTTGNDTVDILTPGNDTVDILTPGNDTVDILTPGNDTAASLTPGNGTAASLTPGNGTAASLTPGNGTDKPTSPVSETPVSNTSGGHTPEIHAVPTTRPPKFAACGKPQPVKKVNRIYGGIKSLPGGQPWQASVQTRAKGTTQAFRHVCGGTLIKSCWVLTAGHCIDNTREYRVVLGSINLGKADASQQTLEVVQTILHEQYVETPESVHNDIALLRLKGQSGQCAQESQFVKTACLPKKDFPDGTECSISGWGATAQSRYGSNQLLDAEVLLISQETCSSANVYGKVVDSSMFCAGYLEGGVDACQ